MIRRDYHIKRYDWVIHVLYNVTCSRTSDIIALLAESLKQERDERSGNRQGEKDSA